MIAPARWSVLAYGLLCYLTFLAVFAYTVGFVSGVGVPRTIDGPVTSPPMTAAAIDLLLLGLFGVQHSVMARPAFKRRWTRWVPTSVERSTYVLVSSLVLVLVYWQWRPIDSVIWSVTGEAARIAWQSLLISGWALVLVATALINHADLFGLRQVWSRLCGRRYFSPAFVTPGPYRLVRHPLYLGWLLSFWATPHMTAGHLLFAVFMTAYVRVAISFEERDLVAEHGVKYRRYRDRIPMLVPFARRQV